MWQVSTSVDTGIGRSGALEPSVLDIAGGPPGGKGTLLILLPAFALVFIGASVCNDF